MGRKRGQGWFSSVGFGGRCKLCSREGSSVQGGTQKCDGGEGCRDESEGRHDDDHLEFLRGDSGQQEGCQQIG